MFGFRISDLFRLQRLQRSRARSSELAAASKQYNRYLRSTVRYAPGTPLLFIPINLVDIFCYFSKKFSHFL